MERQTGGASTVRGDVIYPIARGLSLDRLDSERPYRASGWPLYTRADLPDQVAYQMCAALDATRAQIAWDTDDPVGLSDLCGGTDAAPLDVPLHPGAERYYREHGALPA